MRYREFGTTGRRVSVIGYGCAALSVGADRDQAAAVLATVDSLGINLVDTADTYCRLPSELHANERTLAQIYGPCPERVLIATKGGTVRTPTGWGILGEPSRLHRAIVESHAALGGQSPIALWQHHWPDPRYATADVLRSVRRAQDEGLVRWMGVGNYDLQQLREACDCAAVVSIQNQYNLWHRSAESEGLLEFCENRGLVFLAWRPLGGEGLASRLDEIDAVRRLASHRGISPQRLVIAWMLRKSTCLVPLIGSTNPDHIADCAAATDIQLDDQEMSQLNQLRPEELPQRARSPAWVRHPPLA